MGLPFFLSSARAFLRNVFAFFSCLLALPAFCFIFFACFRLPDFLPLDFLRPFFDLPPFLGLIFLAFFFIFFAVFFAFFTRLDVFFIPPFFSDLGMRLPSFLSCLLAFPAFFFSFEAFFFIFLLDLFAARLALAFLCCFFAVFFTCFLPFLAAVFTSFLILVASFFSFFTSFFAAAFTCFTSALALATSRCNICFAPLASCLTGVVDFPGRALGFSAAVATAFLAWSFAFSCSSSRIFSALPSAFCLSAC